MKFNSLNKERRRVIIILMVVGTSLGLIYPLMNREIGDIRALLNGFFIGFTGSILVLLFEFVIFDPHSRKLSFITTVLLKTVLYLLGFLLIILLIKGFIDSIFYRQKFIDYVTGDRFSNFILHEDFVIILIYTLISLLIIVFSLQMSRKLGFNSILNFITGRYHKPREEERLFLYVDLRSSTTLAEKLGDRKYHYLLNDFFQDITDCILKTQGEVYRYVGDKVIVSWEVRNGMLNADCIRLNFYILNELKKQREKYMSKYGVVPRFTSSYHLGNVITGEVGEIKSQVIHYGEVLFELGQIEKKCGEKELQNLVSGNVMKRIELPGIYRAKACMDSLETAGSRKIELYSIEEIGYN